jgi:hypothetical protein
MRGVGERGVTARGGSAGSLLFLITIGHKSAAHEYEAILRPQMRRRCVTEGKMLALRSACWIWAAAVMAVILIPEHDFGGLDRANVQGVGFAVGAVLLALNDRGRPNFLQPRRNAHSLLGYLVIRFGRHLVRIAAMLIVYAALLEIGQYVEVGHSFRFARLAADTGWILLACAALYILARIFLVGPYLGRITRRHLGRVSAAFRCEAAYSALLRDISQAAYAVCVNPSLSADDRLDRVRQLLDKALAAEIPNHNEDLLDIVFGARTSSPAPHRPWVDHATSAVSPEKTT